MQEKTKVLVARAARELATVLLDKNDFVGFAGDEDEPIIGTADMQQVPISGDDFYCYVSNVCVDPCARKRGVARVMMDVVDVLAVRDLGATALVLHVDADNIPAVRLYESVGFYELEHGDERKIFSSEPFVTGDEGDQRILIKPLTGAPQQRSTRSTDPISVVTNRQETILAMNQREQILDLESLIKSLTLTSGATPDELATLQSGLEGMRTAAKEQEVAKEAWLSVIAEQCWAGDDVACETLSVENTAKQAWLAKRADAGPTGSDPALPAPTPYLDTFAMRGKGPSPQSSAKATWMSKVEQTSAGPSTLDSVTPGMMPPNGRIPPQPDRPDGMMSPSGRVPPRPNRPPGMMPPTGQVPPQPNRPPGLVPPTERVPPQASWEARSTLQASPQVPPVSIRSLPLAASRGGPSPVVPPTRVSSRDTAPGSAANAAALAAADLDEEECDVNPFLSSSPPSSRRSPHPPPNAPPPSPVQQADLPAPSNTESFGATTASLGSATATARSWHPAVEARTPAPARARTPIPSPVRSPAPAQASPSTTAQARSPAPTRAPNPIPAPPRSPAPGRARTPAPTPARSPAPARARNPAPNPPRSSTRSSAPAVAAQQSVVKAAAEAAAELDDEDCDVNPFL